MSEPAFDPWNTPQALQDLLNQVEPFFGAAMSYESINAAILAAVIRHALDSKDQTLAALIENAWGEAHQDRQNYENQWQSRRKEAERLLAESLHAECPTCHEPAGQRCRTIGKSKQIKPFPDAWHVDRLRLARSILDVGADSPQTLDPEAVTR